MAEVVLHTALCMCEARSHSRGDDRNNSTVRALRMCDCIAFFLFIWLLVGSNWALRVGLFSNNRDNCDDLSGGGITGAVENGVVSEGLPNTDTSCPDCDPSVYKFTMVTVLIQYMLGICLVLMCCSNLRQCRRQRSCLYVVQSYIYPMLFCTASAVFLLLFFEPILVFHQTIYITN